MPAIPEISTAPFVPAQHASRMPRGGAMQFWDVEIRTRLGKPGEPEEKSGTTRTQNTANSTDVEDKATPHAACLADSSAPANSAVPQWIADALLHAPQPHASMTAAEFATPTTTPSQAGSMELAPALPRNMQMHGAGEAIASPGTDKSGDAQPADAAETAPTLARLTAPVAEAAAAKLQSTTVVHAAQAAQSTGRHSHIGPATAAAQQHDSAADPTLAPPEAAQRTSAQRQAPQVDTAASETNSTPAESRNSGNGPHPSASAGAGAAQSDQPSGEAPAPPANMAKPAQGEQASATTRSVPAQSFHPDTASPAAPQQMHSTAESTASTFLLPDRTAAQPGPVKASDSAPPAQAAEEAHAVRVLHAAPGRIEAGIAVEGAGWLSVEARRAHGETSATISAQSAHLSSAVLSDLPALREHLQRLGLNIEASAASSTDAGMGDSPQQHSAPKDPQVPQNTLREIARPSPQPAHIATAEQHSPAVPTGRISLRA